MRFISKNGRRIMLPESNKDDKTHTHEDGTTHSHPHEGEHTHDNETPNFQKMTKKALGDWAKENNITVDSKKTKANMIEEIKEQL